MGKYDDRTQVEWVVDGMVVCRKNAPEISSIIAVVTGSPESPEALANLELIKDAPKLVLALELLAMRMDAWIKGTAEDFHVEPQSTIEDIRKWQNEINEVLK